MKWMIGVLAAVVAMMSAGEAGDDRAEKMVDVESAKPLVATPETEDPAANPVRHASLDHNGGEIGHVAVGSAVGNSRDYISGVIGGPHDFSQRTGGQTNACAACHVPHVQRVRAVTRGEETDSGRSESSDDDVFLELYRIEGQRATFEPDRYTPGPTSLVCLGCHDGTLASSTMGSAHAMLAGVREGFNVPDGFDWRDHPIGVPYPKGNREYRPYGQVIAAGQVRMPQERVECISCHDPHNTAGVDKMLVMSNRRSALCLSCHIK